LAIEMFLSGFLLLFIIIAIAASVRFGNELISDLDSDTKLQKINDDPKRFKTSIVFALIHNSCIIAFVVLLFVTFGAYSLILGVVWTISRIVESLILSYNEKKNLELLNLARQYSGASGAEKEAVSDLGRTILKTKNYRFRFAQIPFTIGTLAYSILFVTYGVVLPILGWFGIVASILYGLGFVMILVKPDIKAPYLVTMPDESISPVPPIGGLLIWIFEIVVGVWLIYSSIFIL